MFHAHPLFADESHAMPWEDFAEDAYDDDRYAILTDCFVSEKVATENRFELSNKVREQMLADPAEKRWLYQRVLTTYHDTTLWHDFVESLDVQKVADFTSTFILRAHLITRFLYGEIDTKIPEALGQLYNLHSLLSVFLEGVPASVAVTIDGKSKVVGDLAHQLLMCFSFQTLHPL